MIMDSKLSIYFMKNNKLLRFFKIIIIVEKNSDEIYLTEDDPSKPKKLRTGYQVSKKYLI